MIKLSTYFYNDSIDFILSIVCFRTQDTVVCYLDETTTQEERYLLDFNHLTKEFLEQMIPYLKVLVKGIENQSRKKLGVASSLG